VEKAMTLLQWRIGGNKFHYADVSNFLFDFGLHFVNIEIMQHMGFLFDDAVIASYHSPSQSNN
jgi:hypothetical protein